MADNDSIELVDGVNTTVASDDIAGVKHPRVKVQYGVDGAATDVSGVAPLPVIISDGTTTATVRNLAANDAVNVAIVDGSGAQVTSFAGSGGTAMTDDAPFTPASGSITPAGFMFDDATPDSVNEGDAGVGRMSANRNQYVTIRDAAGNERGLNIDTNGALAVSSAPVVARTADSIAVALQTDAIMNGLTAVTPARAVIAAASSGDNTVISAQGASNKIRVHSLFVIVASAVTIRFESGAGGTALTGQMQLAANGGFVLPFNPLGWFETAGNTLLNLELSSAVSVAGNLQYSVVT